jgi:Ca2+-transporting ATPase
MGTRGTDVAREAAALVLLNDNFSAIVDTIGAGRRIFDNLRKAFAFLVATHLPIVGMALIPVALGLPLVLLPVHIMFLELIIAPVCSIVFEMEEADANTMARPPRLPREPLFNRATVMLGIAQGCALLVAVLFAYFWSMRQFADSDLARTMAFTTLAAANLALIVANRARAGSLLATLLKSNRAFWWVTLMMLSMLATALYVPAVRNLFMFKLPNAGGFTVCALAIMAALLGFEVIRRLLAKRLD